MEFLGNGVVRLDSLALASLACLHYSDDFRVVTVGDDCPVLIVGQDRYPVIADTGEPEPQR